MDIVTHEVLAVLQHVFFSYVERWQDELGLAICNFRVNCLVQDRDRFIKFAKEERLTMGLVTWTFRKTSLLSATFTLHSHSRRTLFTVHYGGVFAVPLSFRCNFLRLSSLSEGILLRSHEWAILWNISSQLRQATIALWLLEVELIILSIWVEVVARAEISSWSLRLFSILHELQESVPLRD